jgi:hypothetical protein
MYGNKAFAVLSLIMIVPCCTNVQATYTMTTGSHADSKQWDKESGVRQKRVVVWGNNPGTTNAAIERLQRAGDIIVERARLQAVFNEQKIHLTSTPDDDADVLRVGKLVGADRVVFVQASDSSEGISGAYVGPYGGESHFATVHHVSVNVRSVDAETGEILWNGSSTTNQPINDPGLALVLLTHAAMLRALCPVGQGAEWVEFASDGSTNPWGCKVKK